MPARNISLEAMARRLSRIADDTFEKFGELPDMLWLVDAADEMGLHIMVIPSIEEQREVMPVALRRYFAEHGVTRYVSALDCWYTEYPNEGGVPLMVKKPSLDPLRKEAVVICAEDKTRRLTAVREIVRPTDGKPYLDGKLELVEDPLSAGRLANLLPGQAEMTSH
jgi:hypothetical protein